MIIKLTANDWEITSIGELATVKRGASPRPIQDPKWWDENSPIGWVRISDVTAANKYLNKTQNHLSELGIRYSVQIEKGQVILSICATIGLPTITNFKVCIHDGFVWFDNLRNDVSREFLYDFFSFKQEELISNKQTGTQGNINTDIVSKLKILLPPCEEQEKIADILSTIDLAITQTEAIIAKQQRIKTGLVQDLLTKGIDENGNIRSEATHEFKDSSIGRIPVEWDVEIIGKIASLQRGHDIRESDLIAGVHPVISSSGIIGFHNESTSNAPNVLVGRKGSIGNVHYIEIDCWAHDTSLFVTNFFGNNEKYIYYLFLYLKLEKFGTKSGSPSLNRNDIHPLRVGLPSSIEQKQIVSILSACDKCIVSLQKELHKAQSKKTGLMQDLLTGKVRVTPLLEFEKEPASR